MNFKFLQKIPAQIEFFYGRRSIELDFTQLANFASPPQPPFHPHLRLHNYIIFGGFTEHTAF